MTACAVGSGTVEERGEVAEGDDAPGGAAPRGGLADTPTTDTPTTDTATTDTPAIPPPPPYRPLACVLSADGGYAARLAAPGGAGRWCPERWTLDGPEPYAVSLPGSQPEDPHSQLLPLADGRVLILRRADGRYRPSLLYPTGPGTGEVPLGAVAAEQLALLPPAPDGSSAWALAAGAETTAVWRLTGGADGPQRVAVVPGHCADGVWLGRDGRLLALNRRGADGLVKAVVVDLGRGGAVSPLLEIAEGSNDRLLLADPDSGLLLLRSDAPGADRVGWGVLDSHRPVRFPEALHQPDVTVTPFAVQPGQALLPERCAVALRVESAPRPGEPCGAELPWVAVWRPGWRGLSYVPAPNGWLRTGRFTAGGELLLPYATGGVRCGLARLRPEEHEDGPRRETTPGAGRHRAAGARPKSEPGPGPKPGPGSGPGPDPAQEQKAPEPDAQVRCKPVPLGKAPLAMAAR